MRPLSVLLSVAALVASVLVVSSPASAGTPKKPMTAQQRTEAKRQFDQARLSYDRGRYEDAISMWEKSYELSGEPLIFESIANAYERLGDSKQARESLAKWRAEAPPNEHAALDERLASLDARIRRDEDQSRTEAERRKRDDQARLAIEQERARVSQQGEKLKAQDEAAEQREAEIGRRVIAGWTLGGVGVAAVVTGVILDAVAAGSRPSEQTACGSSIDGQVCRDSLRSDIENSNTLAVAGDVTWITGSAITVTGAVLLLTAYLGGSAAPEATPAPAGAAAERSAPTPVARLVPMLAPTELGLGLVGRF
jgi:hypothetical protein